MFSITTAAPLWNWHIEILHDEPCMYHKTWKCKIWSWRTKLQDKLENKNAWYEIEGPICKICLAFSGSANCSVISMSCIFMCCNLVVQFHVLHFHASGFWWPSLSGPAFSLDLFAFMFCSRDRNVEPPSPLKWTSGVMDLQHFAFLFLFAVATQNLVAPSQTVWEVIVVSKVWSRLKEVFQM